MKMEGKRKDKTDGDGTKKIKETNKKMRTEEAS